MPTTLQKIISEIKKIGRGIKYLRSFKFKDFGLFFRITGWKEKLAMLLLLLVAAAGVGYSIFVAYLNHTKSIAAAGGVYAEAVIGGPRYLNPLLAQTDTDKLLDRLIYSGLYKFDADGKFVPDLAASDLQIATNQKEYTVAIRPNILWQDGQPLTADDIVYTYATAANADYKSPYFNTWKDVKVTKVDDLTVKFTLKSVSSPFATNLILGILPEHIWGQITAANFATSKYNLEPVGTGPYVLKEKIQSHTGQTSSFSLESFHSYYQNAPLLSKISINFFDNDQDAITALHAKSIDGLGFIPFDKKIYVDQNKTNLEIYKIPVFEYQAIFFNQAKNQKVLGDASVRTALARSIDRDQFINTSYDGLALPAYGPIMPGQVGFDSSIQQTNTYDLDAANNLLDQAGWALDGATGFRAKDGQVLRFSVTTNDFAANIQGAQNLKDQWKKIGADVLINIVHSSDLEQNYIRPKNYESILFAESTGSDPDPFIFWHSSQSQLFNLALYKNPAADKLITEGRGTFDPAVRDDKYRQFQALIAQDVPAVFLDQTEYVYELNPKVKGVVVSELAKPEDRFYDVTHWYISTKRVNK